jgi:hypothetical protein
MTTDSYILYIINDTIVEIKPRILASGL